ncbi:hypothetical protein RX327_02785 [Bradyrhizobium sp. BEA-2-5]|uniref:hypothetical protein n=1 Tax=Bradyrhizobium sp. BEA-2-5 TaxID=3080015 RepID=UPI00293F6066|nr:hypothetical protein [Bradyrhizobium sp. BEA-2-5]WOH82142.1 hypothetical protein RX327_02785 [Bradyrhizobium sp. BEA-2-5]
MTDIFKFWSKIGKADTIHPLDRPVFARLNGSHGFDLRCLPAHFGGKLRTARVVLLYLSPGLSETDVRIARSKEGQEQYVNQRTGRSGFTDHHPEAARWRKERLAWLGEPSVINEKVAIANIGAYHSRAFTDHHILAALPSSRTMLDWAQSVLFPQAERGDRMVVCLRAANFWGLDTGRRYGKALFAPQTTRSGHMRRGKMRDVIERMARRYV